MSTQNEAQAVNAALADPVPRIGDAPVTTVKLYQGLFNATTNEWETTAVVSELTGEDEEALAALEADDDLLYAQYMSALLKRSVKTIGNINVKDNPGLIDQLIIGDRDTLFLATVQATYGENREYQVRCPHCTKSNDVLIELSEFPVKGTDKGPGDFVEVTLRNGTLQKFRLVNGGDSQHVSTKAKSIPEQNTILISRCAVFEEGQAPADSLSWAKKLGLKDRAAIIDALFEAQPGPEIKEVEAHCAHCEKPFPIALNWASLLFG
jgi:hypothetical protein